MAQSISFVILDFAPVFVFSRVSSRRFLDGYRMPWWRKTRFGRELAFSDHGPQLERFICFDLRTAA